MIDYVPGPGEEYMIYIYLQLPFAMRRPMHMIIGGMSIVNFLWGIGLLFIDLNSSYVNGRMCVRGAHRRDNTNL